MVDDSPSFGVDDIEPYTSAVEFAGSYLRVVVLRRFLNRLLFGREDPQCVPGGRSSCLPNHGEQSGSAHVLAELVATESVHKARLAATRSTGVRFPLDRLVEQHSLSDDEREIVELVMAETLDLRAYRDSDSPTAGRIARTLAGWDEDRVQEYACYLVPTSRLFDMGILVEHGTRPRRGTMLRGMGVGLSASAVRMLRRRRALTSPTGRSSSRHRRPTELVRLRRHGSPNAVSADSWKMTQTSLCLRTTRANGPTRQSMRCQLTSWSSYAIVE
jgi:hypothetical protein